MRFGANTNMDEVKKALGYGADRKIMDARLAGLSTDDLKALARVGAIREASLDWHRTYSLVQLLGTKHNLLTKSIKAGLSPKEVNELARKNALTEEGLDTVIAIQRRSPESVKPAYPNRGRKTSIQEQLRKATAKLEN